MPRLCLSCLPASCPELQSTTHLSCVMYPRCRLELGLQCSGIQSFPDRQFDLCEVGNNESSTTVESSSKCRGVHREHYEYAVSIRLCSKQHVLPYVAALRERKPQGACRLGHTPLQRAGPAGHRLNGAVMVSPGALCILSHRTCFRAKPLRAFPEVDLRNS